MATVLWTRVRLVASVAALLALMAVAVPASAGAAKWQRLADPPGGGTLADFGGTAYVAYASPEGVRVVRANSRGTQWQQVGSLIRHTAGAAVFDPSLAQAPDGSLWVTWTEADAYGTLQVRVARFDGSAWHEVVGGDRPINSVPFNPQDPTLPASGHQPHLTFYKGVPYVAYVQDNPTESVLEIYRLNAAGTAWERTGMPGTQRADRPRIVVSGGQLYVAADDYIGGLMYYRFDPSGPRWVAMPYPVNEFADFGDLTDLGGRPALLFSTRSLFESSDYYVGLAVGDPPRPPVKIATSETENTLVAKSIATSGRDAYVAWIDAGRLRIARLKGGSWKPLPSPAGAGANVVDVQLAADSKGVYVMWSEATAGGVRWHVARLK